MRDEVRDASVAMSGFGSGLKPEPSAKGDVRLESITDYPPGTSVPAASAGDCATHRVSRILQDLLGRADGGVVALVALFLPIAVLCVGMVVDLGAVFFARKAVQAACDLGALAGVQELDWDRLAAGQVMIREDDGEDIADGITRENLRNVAGLVEVLSVSCSVRNPPQVAEASLSVEVRFRVRTPFLGSVPGLFGSFEGRAYSQASVVRRTKW